MTEITAEEAKRYFADEHDKDDAIDLAFRLAFRLVRIRREVCDLPVPGSVDDPELELMNNEAWVEMYIVDQV